MKLSHSASLVTVIAAISIARPTIAEVAGGGGSASVDCLVVFDAPVNAPSARPRHVRCVDGDASCDADGVANGACEIEVSVCANSTFNAGCTLRGVQSIRVEHALDDGDPRFDPDFQALQSRVDEEIELPADTADLCTAPSTIRVVVKGPLGKSNRCSGRNKKLKVTSLSQVVDGRIRKDKDRLKLTCLPAPASCVPRSLFTGTFDRIQRQVFDQSCALGACHDSESTAGDLLLEPGAAFGNLVGQVPSNGSARDEGWLRVDAQFGMGDWENSLLHRKITGDLPDAGFGERMPLGGKKLHSTLREVVRLWIGAGAPQDGWVTGTD